jgi:phage terminase Nu1 subunit (DNA packaging protein)
MQAELWSLNALAVELGRDRRALARDLEGLVPDESTRKGGRTERKWKLKRVVEHLYRTPASAEAEDFDNQRERLAAAQAEKFEMENALRRGELAEASKVQSAWADHIAAARAKLLAMPSKLGPQLTHIADPNVVQARIRVEVNAAISELAEWELPESDGVDQPDAAPDGGAVAPAAGSAGERVGRRKQEAQQRVGG